MSGGSDRAARDSPSRWSGWRGAFPARATWSAFWRNLRDGRGVDHPLHRRRAARGGRDRGDAARPALRPRRGGAGRTRPLRRRASSATRRARRRCWTRSTACSWSAPGRRWRTPGYDPARVGGRVGVYAGAGTPAYTWQPRARPTPTLVAARGRLQAGSWPTTRTSWPPASRTSWTCAAPPSTCRRRAPPRWWPSTWPARPAERRVRPGAGRRRHRRRPAARAATCYAPGGIVVARRALPRLRRARGGHGGRRAASGVVVLKRLADALARRRHRPRGDPGLAPSTTTARRRSASPRPAWRGRPRSIARGAGGGGRGPGHHQLRGGARQRHRRWATPSRSPRSPEAFGADADARGLLRHRLGEDQRRPPGRGGGGGGLIKTVLALEHGEIPPTCTSSAPNPKIDFDGRPFFVNAELRAVGRRTAAPRRAGVSSFGIGGTNAHVVLEEAPAPRPPARRAPGSCSPLSARTPAGAGRGRGAAGRAPARAPGAAAGGRRLHAAGGAARVRAPPHRSSSRDGRGRGGAAGARAAPDARRRGGARRTAAAPSPSSSPAWATSTRGWRAGCTRPSPSSARRWTAAPRSCARTWGWTCARSLFPGDAPADAAPRGGHRPARDAGARRGRPRRGAAEPHASWRSPRSSSSSTRWRSCG